MQLVLANDNDARFLKTEDWNGQLGAGWRCTYNYETNETVAVLPDLQDGLSPAEKYVSKSIGVIKFNQRSSGDNGLLTIKLVNQSAVPYMYDLTIKSESSFNILKELKERFQNNVKISFSMNYVNDVVKVLNKNTEFRKNFLIDASAKEMTIDGENHTCRGLVYIEENRALLENMGWHVQITAEILDDELGSLKRKQQDTLQNDSGGKSTKLNDWEDENETCVIQ